MPVLGDDIAFARQPNGIGSFVIKAHTFNKNNDGTTPNQDEVKPDGLLIFPNPTSSVITIESKTGSPQWVSIYNSFGQLMIRKLIKKETLNTYDWPQWCLPSKNQVSKH